MPVERPRILLLPGDGVGPEVVEAAVTILDATGVVADYPTALVGGRALDEIGAPFEDELLDEARSATAVLLGAVGDARYDGAERRPEEVLFALRRTLGVYANLRPVKPLPGLADRTPLRPEIVAGADILIVRELTGGIYYGARGRTEDGAFDTLTYSEAEIERVVRYAFDLARSRRRRLASVDKANVLETSRLWRTIVNRVAGEHRDVAVEHLYVDNAAMQLVLRPSSFDVIVTENMFGDILSDEAAVLAGSLGMLPSASLGGAGGGLYEPVHGTAPDIARTGKANPVGAILSAAMLLRHALGDEQRAFAVERAVASAIEGGVRTPDLGGTATTQDVTRAVLAHLPQGVSA